VSYITCVDIESTGLDVGKDKIIELGMVLWDTERNSAVKMSSILIKDVEIPPLIVDITGIHQEHCDRFGIELIWALETLNAEYLPHSTHVMAHNAPFDRSFLVRDCKALNLAVPTLPWIDTMHDLPYPSDKLRKGELIAIAAKHGFLNPFSHRAVFDCLTTCVLASKYSWEKIFERAASPLLEIVAEVDFQRNKLAKQAGFFWNAEKSKWIKEIKEMDFSPDIPASWAFRYQVKPLKGDTHAN